VQSYKILRTRGRILYFFCQLGTAFTINIKFCAPPETPEKVKNCKNISYKNRTVQKHILEKKLSILSDLLFIFYPSIITHQGFLTTKA
jgi:hypothetical protein